VSTSGNKNIGVSPDNSTGGVGRPPEALPVYLVQVPPEPEGPQADLQRLWHLFVKFRVIIAAFALATTIPAIIYAITAEPVYRSKIVVSAVQSANDAGGLSALASQFGGLASLAGIGLGSGTEKEQAIAVLKSRAFTEEFIKDKNLMAVLFADDWDEKAEQWKPKRWLFFGSETPPTMADAFEKFDQEVRSVHEDTMTGLITLTVDWSDPGLAAEWANDLIFRLNDYLRQIAIDESKASIEYLNSELESSGMLELRQAIFRLIEQQIEAAMLANTNKEYAFKILDPAFPADEDDYVWPLRAVIVAFGFLLGALIGTMVALIIHATRPRLEDRIAAAN